MIGFTPPVTIEYPGLDELKEALEEVDRRRDSLFNAIAAADKVRLSIQTKINQPSAETND